MKARLEMPLLLPEDYDIKIPPSLQSTPGVRQRYSAGHQGGSAKGVSKGRDT